MAPDLATFLATYGAIVDGPPTLLIPQTSWSIGGIAHTGIGGSHSNYESDASALKADLYQHGDLNQLVMSQWNDVSLPQAVLRLTKRTIEQC